MSVEMLFKEFKKLNRQDKQNFLDQVLDSFTEKENPSSLTEAQMAIVKERVISIKNGTAKTYSWQDVKTYALNKNA